MRSGTELVREIQLTDWSTAGNLSNRSSGVQIPCDICTRLKRYLYSAKCNWIISHLIMWLAPEWARWTKSHTVIGYSSEQDGAILPAWDYPPCPTRKISQKPYNKSFIDQAFLIKMAGYWPHSFFAVLWTPTPSLSINIKKKMNLPNIQPSWPLENSKYGTLWSLSISKHQIITRSYMWWTSKGLVIFNFGKWLCHMTQVSLFGQESCVSFFRPISKHRNTKPNKHDTQEALTGRNQYLHKAAQEFSSICFCQDKYKN